MGEKKKRTRNGEGGKEGEEGAYSRKWRDGIYHKAINRSGTRERAVGEPPVGNTCRIYMRGMNRLSKSANTKLAEIMHLVKIGGVRGSARRAIGLKSPRTSRNGIQLPKDTYLRGRMGLRFIGRCCCQAVPSSLRKLRTSFSDRSFVVQPRPHYLLKVTA